MADDPPVWLQTHIHDGIHLREECRPLETLPECEAWEDRAETWRVDLWNGLNARRPGDSQRIDVLDDLICKPLPIGHPWHHTTELFVSATGIGQPGNNPFNYHCTRIKIAKKILEEWRTAKPRAPKPAGPTKVARAEFDTWFASEAAEARPGDRRGVEETKRLAQEHFKCLIPIEWAKTAHSTKLSILLPNHTWRTRGRRPDN